MPDPIEVTRDAPRTPLPDVDPAVRIPDSVKAASLAADEVYKQAYSPQNPVEPPAPNPVEPPPPVEQQLPPGNEPPPIESHEEDKPPEGDTSTWDAKDHKYNRMRGRYAQSQKTIKGLQDQLSQLGDELIQTQQLLSQQPAAQQPLAPVQQEKLITEADEQNFGKEFIDVARRAALEALHPEIDALRRENQYLKQRQTNAGANSVHAALDAAVPDWRTVNKSPEFNRWLALRDIYSGMVRKQLLNDAFQAANAPRVVAFFKGFISDELVTGNRQPAQAAETSQPEQPAPPAARQAATTLENLAAPGRAKPAAGNTPAAPESKPTYTHRDISTFYADVRRGAYLGREKEKLTIEHDIFAAQREGRIR